MNRNKIATALGIALVISALFTIVLAKQMNGKKRVVTDQTYIALNKPIAAGTVIKPEDVKTIAWPSNVPLAGAFTKTADVVGRTAMESLAQDSPVLNQNLAAIGAGVGLSGHIPDGMRAISLKSDEVVGVSGFLFPGSHVDVLVTYHTPGINTEPITTTVLQDVQVLAAGNKTIPDPTGQAATVNEVTLLLTPEDAAKAVLASSQGAIHYVLRNGSDAAQGQNTTVDLATLATGLPATSNGAAKAVTKVPYRTIHATSRTGYQVVTIAGDKSVVSSF